MLRPPAASPLAPSLVESTLRLAIDSSPRRSATESVKGLIGWLIERTAEFRSGANVRRAVSVVLLCACLGALGIASYQVNLDSKREAELPLPTRYPSAVALPLDGITIDGRLDDWPENSPLYPIRNQLMNHSSYAKERRDGSTEPDAHFMVGYDRGAGLIYLAVVVPDQVVIAVAGGSTDSDAVEVYLDGSFSKRAIADPVGDWREALDAAAMPVLQYVAIPADVPAYRDSWNANPSLVYARTQQSATKMVYRHTGGITTYEWAIQAYDTYPDQPTRLQAGKRLGIEVAVVDKDDPRGPPTFLTWGQPPARFKGLDAGSLGELILLGAP
jgi:hypothetical protein